MRFEGAFLRSRVARRVVSFFIASALLPLAVTAFLSLGQVQNLLADQGHARLAQTNESYASSLYDRLLAVEQAAADVAARDRPDAPITAGQQKRLRRQFNAIGMVGVDGVVAELTGTFTAVPDLKEIPSERIAEGRFTVATATVSDRAPAVFLVRAIDGARGDARFVAEIDPTYLWGDPTALTALTGLCVSDEQGRLLFCSNDAASKAAGVFAAIEHGSVAGQFSFVHRGEPYLAAFRELFLKAQFGAQGWTIVTTKSQAEVFAPITAFRALFIPVIGLALLVVALLSVSQVRRTLDPLEKLIEGTRRAGEGDLSARVSVRADDEFGELAASFNAMATRLGSQFSALLTLADIDQAILSRLDLDRVVETVLARMCDIVAADYVGIGIVDRDAPAMLRLYARDHANAGPIEIERCAFSAADKAELLATLDGQWRTRRDAVAAHLAPIARFGAGSMLVLPIVWQGDVIGTVVLGYRDNAAATDEDRVRARNLGDRVGVAFATAVKDEQLYYRANYDALTGLPNRLYFKDQLGRRLAHAQRMPEQRFALLFLDLDNFKNVNDSVGHAAGDEVLRQMAGRLEQCVREADTVTRLGGDEFTIIVSDIGSTRGVEVAAERIIDAMGAPFVVDGNEHFMSASIGIALYPADGSTADDLLRNADTAMYRAKEAGRGRYVYFEEQMNAAALARLSLERELRLALERGEFCLHYQPQIDLRSRSIAGAEALLRWESPNRGQRMPAEFIQLAEETGLIEPIGDWVLHEACAQFVAWQAAGIRLPRLAVNVSPRQFRQKDFVSKLKRIVASTGMAPHDLELEITESLLIDAASGVAAMLDELRAMGVGLSLDDFGTGYSSLAYLKRFPLETLKIDRSFIDDLADNDDSIAIARAIITMAHALRKRVVAEGVETEKQLSLLAELDCDAIQGYYVSAPLSSALFARLVSESQYRLQTATAARSRTAAAA